MKVRLVIYHRIYLVIWKAGSDFEIRRCMQSNASRPSNGGPIAGFVEKYDGRACCFLALRGFVWVDSYDFRAAAACR
jgi:hypothetical protein